MLQAVVLLLFMIVIVSLSAFLIFNVYSTWRTQSGALQKTWITGKLPVSPLDGFYKGTSDFRTTWIGKKFNVAEMSGINLFKAGEAQTEKYRFKMYPGKGIWETNLDVIKIDYSSNENPFWVRMIVDELVETEPGKYLGKIHASLLPGVSFVLGFFKLEKGE